MAPASREGPNAALGPGTSTAYAPLVARSILLERRNRHAQSAPISCGTAASASDHPRALERARCALASPPARLLCVIPSAGFFGMKAALCSRLTTCATIHTNQKKGVISFDIPSQAEHNPPAALPCVHHPARSTALSLPLLPGPRPFFLSPFVLFQQTTARAPNSLTISFFRPRSHACHTSRVQISTPTTPTYQNG